jgi:pimeloyl-ACP methyl ester carboxylesterase
MAAARSPPTFDPANSQLRRPMAMLRIARSAMLLSISRRPSLSIPGAGHMIQFDQPDAWRAAVREFIRAHDA